MPVFEPLGRASLDAVMLSSQQVRSWMVLGSRVERGVGLGSFRPRWRPSQAA